MNERLIETSDRIYIPNVPRLYWGKNMENTFLKSLQLCLNEAGENFTYEYLMGISGAAFRLHFHMDWCPSSPDATVGYDISSKIFGLLGYHYKKVNTAANNIDEIRSSFNKIKAIIDSGKPIIGINLKESPDWGIITGYLKKQPGILCRTYYDGSDEYSIAEHMPEAIFYMEGFYERKEDKYLIMNSFKEAVNLAKTKAYDKYLNGYSAYNYWISALSDEDNFRSKYDLERKIHANAWIFVSLIDARLAAVNYLRQISNLIYFGNIDLVMNNYSRIVEILKDSFKYVPFPKDLKGKEWTQETRDEQVKALKFALTLEKETISIIEEYLESFH